MECPHIPDLGYGQFAARLRAKVGSQRVPITGSLELTHRCNLRCVHCYLAGAAGHRAAQPELTSREMCGIVDQVVGEGCLWLLLTGGEPLVRPDLIEIYTHAKRRGLILTLFTNGTRITPRIADYLAEWPPFVVEISVYGRTEQTYERVTGVPGSYARCMRGIELLLERNVPLKLKTMLMTLNKHELWDIQAWAESLGVRYRFDPMMNAGLEDSKHPLDFRLTPEEVVQFDLEDPTRTEEWQAFCDRFRNVPVDDRYLYICGAGLTSFHIDPCGNLSPCLIARTPAYELCHGSFHEGWHDFLARVRYQAATPSYPCGRCELLPLCGQCPGWAQLEHGDPEEPVEFLCQVAHLRAELFGWNGASQPAPEKTGFLAPQGTPLQPIVENQ